MRTGALAQRLGLGALSLYLALSAAFWHVLLRHPGSVTEQGASGDPGLFVWWFAWAARCVQHLHNPLHTTYLQAPTGISAVWNTSMLAVGLLATPLTLAAGPVATYNLVLVLSAPLSGWTMFLWARRWAATRPAVAAGLLFGFSPYMTAELLGHLHLTFLVLVPLLCWSVERLCWDSRPPRRRDGLTLGLLVVLQFFVSAEVLLMVGLGLATAIAVLAVQRRALLADRLRRVLAPASWSLAVTLGGLALPVQDVLSARYRIGPPVQALGYVGPPAIFVHASPVFAAFSARHYPRLTLLNPSENGSFLGWPLVIVLVVVTVAGRRDLIVRSAAAVAVLAGCCQVQRLSPLLAAEQHVGVLHNIVTSRVSVVMWAAVAVLVGRGLSVWALRWPEPRWVRGLAWAAAGLAAVALLPTHAVTREYQLRHVAGVPVFFRDRADVRLLAHRTVLVLPLADSTSDVAEYDQVVTGLQFRLVGGYAVHSVGPHHLPSLQPPQTSLDALVGAGRVADAALTRPLVAAAAADVAASGATVVVVDAMAPGAPSLTRRVELLLGRPPALTRDGVTLWWLADR